MLVLKIYEQQQKDTQRRITSLKRIDIWHTELLLKPHTAIYDKDALTEKK